jgi:hypothetical protein
MVVANVFAIGVVGFLTAGDLYLASTWILGAGFFAAVITAVFSAIRRSERRVFSSELRHRRLGGLCPHSARGASMTGRSAGQQMMLILLWVWTLGAAFCFWRYTGDAPVRLGAIPHFWFALGMTFTGLAGGALAGRHLAPTQVLEEIAEKQQMLIALIYMGCLLASAAWAANDRTGSVVFGFCVAVLGFLMSVANQDRSSLTRPERSVGQGEVVMPDKGLTRREIQVMWEGQNPDLVENLKRAGTLPTHLSAASETTRTVMGSALAGGLNEDQGRELARDAVGLPCSLDDDNE